MKELAEAKSPWAIPWPCIHELLAIVNHPRIYSPPTPLAAAIHQVEAWLESPSLILLAETEGYWPELRVTLEQGRIGGPQVHDARVAAICRDHGVHELWTSIATSAPSRSSPSSIRSSPENDRHQLATSGKSVRHKLRKELGARRLQRDTMNMDGTFRLRRLDKGYSDVFGGENDA
jgi:predicted nucleic acid-binding protein